MSLERFLNLLIKKLDLGIAKAKDKKNNLYFTYFSYEVTKYRKAKKGIIPLGFKRRNLPLFLEGLVSLLRVEKKRDVYFSLKRSCLFDRALKMYRLNASLESEPLEIGRSRIFVPGWLENESIWLHMQYKYLLEVLRVGLYEEFFQDLYQCAVCFFDPQRYARNPLENSSFIVSSAHPDKTLWGKGFVGRLSGATVEFLHIWMLLCLGEKPFFLNEDRRVCLRFRPILKKDFFTQREQPLNWKGKDLVLGKDSFSFKLFGSILVTYYNPQRKDTFAKQIEIEKIVIFEKEDSYSLYQDFIPAHITAKIRNLEIDRIEVHFR